MTEYVCSLDPEGEVACPYDNSHMVRRKRMQYHLMKCRKNHPGKEFATCPFNACHEMPRPELRYHMATCPNKAVIEKDRAYEQELANGDVGMFKGCTDVPAYHSYEITTSECWDDEANPHPRIGVDPMILNKVKFKNITGMTAAEKREFHRFLPPDEDEPTIPHSVQNGSRQNKENERPPPPQTEGKLRLPKNAPKAFSMYQGAAPPPQPPASTVFAYSLAQAGLGRGRGVASTTPSAPPGIPRPAMGRGVPRNADLHPQTSFNSQLGNQVPRNADLHPQTSFNSQLSNQVPRNADLHPQTSFNSQLSNQIPRNADLHPQTSFNSQLGNQVPFNPYVQQPRSTELPSQLQAYRVPETIAQVDPVPQPPAPTQTVEDLTRYEDIPPESPATRSRLFPAMTVPDNVFADQYNLKPVGRGKSRRTETNGYSAQNGVAKFGSFTDWSVLNIGKAGDNMGGLGRGIKKSPEPTFIMPNVLNKKPTSLKMISKDWFDIDGSSSESGSGSDISSRAVTACHGIEDAKKSKQIQKKLRQIEALEAMQKSGKQLNTEEEVKLSKKEDFLAELEALCL